MILGKIKEIKKTFIGNLEVILAQGDITQAPVEAIVNAANKFLIHGGGVALAIAREATGGSPTKYVEVSQKAMAEQVGRMYIEHGEVVVTPGMELEKRGIKYVIHTVGPKCQGRWDPSLKSKLRMAIMGALEKAEELGVSSVAFPMISAGIYGCPFREVLLTFLECLSMFSREAKNVKKVYLVIYDEKRAKEAAKYFV